MARCRRRESPTICTFGGGATGSVQAERNYVQERLGLDRFDPSTNARLPGQLGRVAGQVPTLAEGERRVGGQVSALSGRTGIGGEEGAPAVTLQGRALSAEGLAEGSYRLNGQGLRANGQVRAGLVLGEGRAEALGGRVAGSVTAGANASMAGELTVDPTTGRYQGQVTVDNFVGVRAEARARVGTDNLSATGTVAAQAGLGLTARLEAGLNGNRLRGRMEFGAALGIGARARRAAARHGPAHLRTMTVTLRELLANGQRAEAEHLAQQRLCQAPRDAEALAALASLQLERGDIDAARSTLARADEADRSSWELRWVAALIEVNTSEPAVAEALLRQLWQEQPTRPEVAYALGAFLAGEGRAADGLPNHSGFNADKARVLLSLGRTDELVAFCEYLEATGLASTPTRLAQAEALEPSRPAEALALYRRVIQEDAADWLAANAAGLMFLRQSDTQPEVLEQARQLFELARQVADAVPEGPLHNEAERLIRFLSS